MVITQPISPSSAGPNLHEFNRARWTQLLFGVICMLAVSNLQYGWTPFVKPLDQRYHWGEFEIQITFLIFVVVESFCDFGLCRKTLVIVLVAPRLRAPSDRQQKLLAQLSHGQKVKTANDVPFA